MREASQKLLERLDGQVKELYQLAEREISLKECSDGEMAWRAEARIRLVEAQTAIRKLGEGASELKRAAELLEFVLDSNRGPEPADW